MVNGQYQPYLEFNNVHNNQQLPGNYNYYVDIKTQIMAVSTDKGLLR